MPWLVVVPPRRHLISVYRATAAAVDGWSPNTCIGPEINCR